jgi:serine/threonine-protein kinase
LTGRPPIEGEDIGEVLCKVQRGEFTPPRQLDPSIDKALQAVCLKAMATNPEDRYPSCRALADDVERWMADEPVTAWREPWTRKSARWLTRHRTGVTGAAAAVLVGVVGLSAVLAVQARANGVLEAKNGDLTRANTALAEAKDRETARFALAAEAIKLFQGQVGGDLILKEDRFKPLRDKLLRSAADFYIKLEKLLEGQTDLTSRRRLGDAYDQLASLTNEIGDKAAALAIHQKALAARQELVDENPAVAEFRSNLADSHNELGVLFEETGKPAEAEAEYRKALAIKRKLADENPAVTEFRRRLGNSLANLGDLLRQMGKPGDGEVELGLAVTMFQDLADENPAVAKLRSTLALAHSNLGILLSQKGRPTEAESEFRAALALRCKLADENPGVTEFSSELAACHYNLGIFLSRTGKAAEAAAEHRKALEIQQKLADDNPAVTVWRVRLASTRNGLGDLLRQMGMPGEGEAELRKAITICRKLADEQPESPDYASMLGAALNNLAYIELQAKQFQDARERLVEAVPWQKKALAANPWNPDYRQSLTKELTNLIVAARRLGRDAEANEAQRELPVLKATDPSFAALDARLAAVLKGDAPKDTAERLALAQRAYDTQRHATSARLWAEAFEAEPKLGDDPQSWRRYNASSAAALAGCGKGLDGPAPADDAARAKIRAQGTRLAEGRTGELGQAARFCQPPATGGHRPDAPALEGGHRPRRPPRTRGHGEAPRGRTRRLARALARGRYAAGQGEGARVPKRNQGEGLTATVELQSRY